MPVYSYAVRLISGYFNNTRKPEGILGRIMVSGMNRAHASVSDWGMDHLSSVCPAKIIDLGCGGGRNASRLLRRFPQAHLTALDYSEIAVEKTKKVNRMEIRNKRCRVVKGNVSHLPFKENSFDLATAFETVYFWAGPTESFQEVWRVLKPCGIFLIVNESDGKNQEDEKWVNIIDGLRIFDETQLSTFLKEAGFSEIIIDRDEAKHRLCIMAVK